VYGHSKYWFLVGGLFSAGYIMAGDVFVAHRSTVNAAEADATFSSFWQSVETATPGFTFPPDNGIPLLTTTSVANPIVSAYLHP